VSICVGDKVMAFGFDLGSLSFSAGNARCSNGSSAMSPSRSAKANISRTAMTSRLIVAWPAPAAARARTYLDITA
jgi:hypothetical protein